MKVKQLILFGLIAVVLTSCDMGSSNNYTPAISFISIVANRTDSLNGFSTDEANTFRLDTINVGDTVVFKLVLNAYYNNLTSFYITQSDTSSTKVILPIVASMDTIFSKPLSDYNNFKFIFLPKKNYVYFPVRYVAKKASISSTIEFLLMSDAKLSVVSGSNSTSIKLTTPIINAR